MAHRKTPFRIVQDWTGKWWAWSVVNTYLGWASHSGEVIVDGRTTTAFQGRTPSEALYRLKQALRKEG
jgi:hypothetical protein